MRTGRIWRQHLPIGAVPPSAAAVVQHLPLPRATPATPLDLRLHRVHGSSDDKPGTLERVRVSKEDSYREQFSARVGHADRDRIERRALSAPSGVVGATVYSPPSCRRGHERDASSSRGVCLHVHGGGWIWGDSRDQVAHRCLEMADALGAHVVSVEYSLFTKPNCEAGDGQSGDGGPPCSFDPVNDVTVALEWIEENYAEFLGAGPRFVASGESAGAHLLMLAMLRRRDRARAGEETEEDPVASSPSRFPPERSVPFDGRWKCLNLVYGVFDLSGTPSVATDGDSSVPLSGNDLLWMYDMYISVMNERLGPDAATLGARDPGLSPMYADLSRMPPSLITVGTADCLVDYTLFMASRLGSFGVDVDLAVYEGGEHGIGHFGVQEDEEMGVEARRYTLEYMRGRLWGE